MGCPERQMSASLPTLARCRFRIRSTLRGGRGPHYSLGALCPVIGEPFSSLDHIFRYYTDRLAAHQNVSSCGGDLGIGIQVSERNKIPPAPEPLRARRTGIRVVGFGVSSIMWFRHGGVRFHYVRV